MEATKLNIKEFRIGNLVDRTDYICRVVGIFEKDNGLVLDAINYKGERFVVQEVKPIPLTEEWLLKMGFEKMVWVNIYVRIKNGKKITNDLDTGYTTISDTHREPNTGISINGIKEVHLIQNIVHALTGEELKIKL